MALNEITVQEDLNNLEIISRAEEMMTCIETPELRKLKRGADIEKYVIELSKRYPHLKGRYPQIFNMVMMYERTFDMNKLKWMLQMLDKRKDGSITPEESDNQVSFRQFDEHVRPSIDYEKEREGLEKARRGEHKNSN